MRIVLISLALAILVTAATLVIPRLGTAYVCDGQSYAETYNRDERGIPFVFIKRSLEGTSFCNFVKASNHNPINRSRELEIVPLLGDITSWLLIIGGLFYIARKVDNHG